MWKSFTSFFVAFTVSTCIAGGQSNAQTLSRILKNHSEIYDRSPVRGAIESIYLRGVQQQGERALELTIHRKRPNSMRYQLGTGEDAVILGYDGEVAWRQTRIDGEAKVERLGTEAARLLRAEAAFASVLSDDMFEPGQALDLEGTERVGGDAAYRIHVSDEADRRSRYYLSSKTYLVLKREQLDAEGRTILETLYRDYRAVGGVPFAHEVENRVEGERVALTRFEEIKLNTGVLSFYFEMPD